MHAQREQLVKEEYDWLMNVIHVKHMITFDLCGVKLHALHRSSEDSE